MSERKNHVLCLSDSAFDAVNPDNLDEVRSIWTALSKAKDAIADGKRLEYLSWRLYSQKVLSISDPHPPSAPPPPLQSSESTATLSSAPMLDMSSSSESIQSARPSITAKQLSQLFQQPKERNEPALLRRPPLESRSSSSFKTVPSMASLAYSQSVLNLAKAASKSPASKKAEFSPKEPPRSVNFSEASPHTPQMRGRPSEVDMTQSHTKAVRGFSPSNISIAVNYSSQNLAAQAGSYSKRASTPTLHRSASRVSQSDAVEDGLGWSKASIPRNKMFFIESSTDSEAGSASSNDSVLHDEMAASHRSARAGSKVTFAQSGDEESEGSIHYYHTDEELDDDGGGDSEWDDLDEEVDDEAEEVPEEQLRFDEREVPARPTVTRSHLSSLFLKKLQQTDAPPPEEPSSGRSSVVGGVAAPATILLGAHVAPHYPLQPEPEGVRDETRPGSLDESELSQSVRDQLKMSRDYDLQSLWAVKRSGARSASRSRSSSQSRHNSQQGWLHSSEDIFDPLNYHSRGW